LPLFPLPAPAGQVWEATQALVVRELLLQRARMLGLAAEPRSDGGLRESDDEALIRTLLETEVRRPRADDEACRRYYQANQSRFRSPDTFEPLHILFQAPRDDEVSFADALARAEAVLVELREAPDRIESLARALSDCPSAREGGRLGLIAAATPRRSSRRRCWPWNLGRRAENRFRPATGSTLSAWTASCLDRPCRSRRCATESQLTWRRAPGGAAWPSTSRSLRVRPGLPGARYQALRRLWFSRRRQGRVAWPRNQSPLTHPAGPPATELQFWRNADD
jgi:hypothetical protein